MQSMDKMTIPLINSKYFGYSSLGSSLISSVHAAINSYDQQQQSTYDSIVKGNNSDTNTGIISLPSIIAK